MRSPTHRIRILLVLTLIGLASGMSPLSAQKKKVDFSKEMSAFFKDIDRNYPFFKEKKIAKDWKAAKRDLLKRTKKCKDEVAFVMLVHEAIGKLRDGHASFTKVRPKMPRMDPEFYSGLVLLPATEKRVVVMVAPSSLAKDFPPGTVITKIEGKDARSWLDARAEKVWEEGGSFSSPQRARFFEYRLPLRGERGDAFKLQYLKNGKKKSKKVRAQFEVKGWVHNYALPKSLNRVAKSVYHADLGEGVGYCWLRRMDATAEEGIVKAQQAQPDAKAWIVDLRGNTGGGYDRSFKEKTKQFGKRVAVVLDAGSVSAAETYARDLVNVCGARIFGATSAGSSSKKKVFEFPSGVAAVRYSVQSRYGPKNKPIEYHGVQPDEVLEARPEDLAAEKNTEIEIAREWLQSNRK